MKKAFLARILIIGMACLVFGCGKKEEGKEDSEKSTTEMDGAQALKIEEKEYKTIGQESANAYKLVLTNRTGGEITGFTIKASAAQEASQNLLQAGMTIALEETVCVYYTPAEEHPSQTAYDLNLSYADGHVVEIAGIGLDGMEQAELCFEDEVGFVKYKNSGSGEEVSTKEMALALKAQNEAQTAAAAQAKQNEAEQAAAQAAAAQAQADASSQGQYDQPTYNEPTYNQPTYNQPSESGGQDADVSQSGEGCLTDPVVNPDVNQSGEGCLTDPVVNPDVNQSGEGCLTDPVMNPDYSE